MNKANTTTLLKANDTNKEMIVNGSFDEVVKSFEMKPKTKVLDCRVDPTEKNKTIWIDGKKMATIIHPDNTQVTWN